MKEKWEAYSLSIFLPTLRKCKYRYVLPAHGKAYRSSLNGQKGYEAVMNKKIVIAVSSVIVVIIAIVVGIFIKRSSDASTKPMEIYYLSESSLSIVPEERKIKNGNRDDVLNEVLENILKGPSDKDNKAVVGDNTRVLSTSFEGTSLTVDFSGEFLRNDKTVNMLSVYAIIKTLCRIDKISRVMITVEGEQVEAADNTPIGFLSNSDINLESDTYTPDSKEIVLYFANGDGRLEKEIRTIKITDTRPIESYIINELIKGPVNQELSATLSSDTELISVEKANNTCHVTFKNFIEENLSSPDSDESKLAVYSIVNSLTELEDVNSVYFLFEGKTEEAVGQFNFSEPLKKNKEIVAEEMK